MQQILCFLGLLVGPVMISAQTIRVFEIATSKPLEWVSLISEDPQAFESTNIHGEADLSGFLGAERIEIRKLGYETQTRTYQELKDQQFEVYLEPTSLNLDEIVVSATRWRQVSNEVPSRIVSIRPEAVALQNPQTAADLLGLSGKIFIQKSQQGGGSPMIRGFATNRLLYTVDGIRMNTAIFRGGNIQNVINLDPFAIEQTEALFGPGSVIYGSDAIGGVMSFQTLKPRLSISGKPEIGGKAVARYASANKERTGHVDVNVGWNKWALATSISSWDYDHLRQGSHGPEDYLKPYFVQRIDSTDRVVTQDDPLLQTPSAYSQINLLQKVRFQPDDHWEFQYGFHFSETSPYGRYDRHNRMRNGLPRYAEWDYGPQQWMMNNLTISRKGGGRFYDRWTLRLAQQAFEESRISRDLNDPLRENRTERVGAYSANLDFFKSVGSNNKLFYGVEYVLNDVDSRGINENIETGEQRQEASRYPQAQWSSMAVYLNQEFRPSNKLSLQAGLRYNYYLLNADFSSNQDFYPLPFQESEVRDAALTGSLGGVYRPDQNWVISANFATAFRAPNVDDIGKVFDSEPGAVTLPNSDLEAEYAYNFDLGLAKIFGETLKLDLSAYYTILDNAMVRRDYQINGQDSIVYDGELSQVQAMQNAAGANVYGLQAGLELQLPAGFSFSSDLNFQRGEEELDDGTTSPSRHAAPFFGVSRLNYRANGLQLQLYVEYQGERSFEELAVEERGKDEIYAKDENGNNYAPAWYSLNFKASVPLSESFTITAGLENITDQRYRPYSSGISGAGRNFILGLQAGF